MYTSHCEQPRYPLFPRVFLRAYMLPDINAHSKRKRKENFMCHIIKPNPLVTPFKMNNSQSDTIPLWKWCSTQGYDIPTLAVNWEMHIRSDEIHWGLNIVSIQASYSSIFSSQPGFFCSNTNPSNTFANGMYSSVASSARSVVASRTGV